MKKTLKYIFGLTMFLIAGICSVLAINFIFKLIPGNSIYANVDFAEKTIDSVIRGSGTSSDTLPSSSPEITEPEVSFEPLIEAYKVIIDGTVVGIVSDETKVNDIICDMQEEYESRENIENTVYELSKEIVVEKMRTYAKNLTEDMSIEDAVAECISFKINAFELSIDGFVVGYFATKEECNSILDTAKDKFIKQNFAGKTVLASSYAGTFDITQITVSKEELESVTYNDAVDIIIDDRKVEKKVIVSDKAQLKALFDKKDISASCAYESSVDAINKNGNTEVLYNERVVDFNVTVQSTKTSSVAYTTEYKANNSMAYNVSKVTRSGKNGTKTCTYSDTYVNNEFISSKLTSEKVTVQPVGAIVEYGTKISKTYSIFITKLTGKGYFKWPSSGLITSLFGSSGHTGIDIAAPAGTPIYASADGKVTKVESLKKGYGRYVIISHSNGYQTYYAHMSKYIVKEGQTVKRGQIIGYVGMTGAATGNHCHFGIVKNGKFIDPTTMLYGYES